VLIGSGHQQTEPTPPSDAPAGDAGDGPASSESDDPAQPSGSYLQDASNQSADLAHISEGLAVVLVMETDEVDPPLAGWIEPFFLQAATHAGVESGQITLACVDDAAMAELHERHSGVPGTTDVLTFDLRDDLADPTLDADLVLCLDESARQAARRGHDTRVEALLYAVHGLLHLLGEDDHDPARAETMHRREDELLGMIGLGPVYAKPG